METPKTELPNLGQVILNGLPKAEDSAKQVKPASDKQVKKSKKKSATKN
jgi:hypothetical protein